MPRTLGPSERSAFAPWSSAPPPGGDYYAGKEEAQVGQAFQPDLFERVRLESLTSFLAAGISTARGRLAIRDRTPNRDRSMIAVPIALRAERLTFQPSIRTETETVIGHYGSTLLSSPN